MNVLILVLVLYLASIVVSWYVITADLALGSTYFWPEWEVFREDVTLTDLGFGLFLALLPGINMFFVVLFGIFHVLENVHFDDVYPLRRKR